MSETTDAINAAEAALETAKAEAIRVERTVVSYVQPEQLAGEAQGVSLVSREEFDALRSELQSLNDRIEATRAEALTSLVAAAPLVQQVAEAVGITVSSEEFEAMRAELQSLNNRIADFNQRSGQRI